METISVADARKAESIGKQVLLRGWVRTRRDSKGGFSFIELNDGSCQGNIQIVADGKLENYEAEIKKLIAGCSVSIEGEVKASQGKGQATEIVAAPKVYSFDTGFACYAKGWGEIRNEDKGILWEHCVLNELHAKLQTQDIHYWRDKKGHEIDFVLIDKKNKLINIIECKLNSANLNNIDSLTKNIQAFRHHYPNGTNFIVAQDVTDVYRMNIKNTTITFVTPMQLIKELKK